MKYKSYSKCKDSGIEWLGKIPEGWELRKIKFLTKEPIKNGLGKSAAFFEEDWPRYIRITDIEGPKKLKDDTFCSLPSEIASGALVKKGDLLMSAVGATYGKSYLHLYDKGDFCYAGYLVKFSPNEKLDFRYVGYWSESNLYWNQVHSNVIQSTIQNFSANKYQQLLILLPSLQEQIKIANYLDKKTEKINAIIEKNKKQIELLKERRQAIISQAVTKGLNPKAKMKDSGIEWLGEIPEGWELKKLRFLCRLNPPKSECKENTNIEVTFLPMDMVGKRGEINKKETRIMKDVYEGYTYFRDNDVLLAKITPCFENGKGALVRNLLNGIGFGTTEFHVLRAYKSMSPEYLYFITYSTSFRKTGEANMIGAAGQKRIPESFVKDFTIGIPSIKEQNRIILGLKNKLAGIDLLMDKIQLQNQKLQEFRQSLISNVVTGKIKV